MARDSSFAEGWAGLTRALQQAYLRRYNWMRQYDSAFAWADSGRRIDPTHILIRQHLAHASFHRGDTATAAEHYRAAVQIGKGPDEVFWWIGLSTIAGRGGDRQGLDPLRGMPRFRALLLRSWNGCR